jgi:hypothetical protein
VCRQNATLGRAAQAVGPKKNYTQSTRDVTTSGPRPPTLYSHVVHRQLQALAAPYQPHGVPLVVVEFMPRKECLGAFTCSTKGGVSMVPTHAQVAHILPRTRVQHNLCYIVSHTTHLRTQGVTSHSGCAQRVLHSRHKPDGLSNVSFCKVRGCHSYGTGSEWCPWSCVCPEVLHTYTPTHTLSPVS